MIVAFALLGIGVIALVAVLLSRPRQLLVDDTIPGRPFAVPAPEDLTPADISSARFSIALRGYRCSEVDQLLGAAQAALAAATAAQPATQATITRAPAEESLEPPEPEGPEPEVGAAAPVPSVGPPDVQGPGSPQAGERAQLGSGDDEDGR